jgi:hypothetical protein
MTANTLEPIMGSSMLLYRSPCSVIVALFVNGAAAVPTSNTPPNTRMYSASRFSTGTSMAKDSTPCQSIMHARKSHQP